MAETTETRLLAIKIRMEMLITQREGMRLHDEWAIANGRNDIHAQTSYGELSDEMLLELDKVERILGQ